MATHPPREGCGVVRSARRGRSRKWRARGRRMGAGGGAGCGVGAAAAAAGALGAAVAAVYGATLPAGLPGGDAGNVPSAACPPGGGLGSFWVVLGSFGVFLGSGRPRGEVGLRVWGRSA